MNRPKTICLALLCQCFCVLQYAFAQRLHQNLVFVENIGQITDQYGQARKDLDFRLEASRDLSVFFAPDKLVYQFSQRTGGQELQRSSSASLSIQWARMTVALIGANPNATLVTQSMTSYYERYYSLGLQGKKAQAFDRIQYKNVYPNIDWVLYTQEGGLKHEFVVHKGGRYQDIHIQYQGASSLKIDDLGNLMASTDLGEIKESAPICYQEDGREVTAHFILKGNTLTYDVPSYKGTLVIDPSLSWSTYYGGVGFDGAQSVATNGNAVYCAGSTLSTTNIATVGAHKSVNIGGASDAYLLKMNTSGVRQWATYFGGPNGEDGTSVAIDNNGSVYLSGNTSSASGIATATAHQSTFAHVGFGQDAFLAKFNTNGVLVWATYYGGDKQEGESYVATDFMGNVFLSGYTSSASGIASAGSYQSSLASADINDAFLVKFNGSGVRLWGTYFGGPGAERGHKVCTDKNGNVYITGQTTSATGIASPTAHQAVFGGTTGSTASDAYVAKFSTDGLRQWSTYYGGMGADIGYATAIDRDLNVYLVGCTFSTDRIATPSAYQVAWAGGAYDAFIAKLDKDGIRQWGTYYGFVGEDVAYDVAVRDSTDVFVVGISSSAFNIASDSAYQKTLAGDYDAMILHFSDSGKRKWSSYYGGTSADYGRQVAVANDEVYVSGFTKSTSGIATPLAHQIALGGTDDGFLLKFLFPRPKAPTLVSTILKNDFGVFPNPSKGVFTINVQAAFLTNERTLMLQVYDLGGRLVLEQTLDQQNTEINLANCSDGMYLYRILQNGVLMGNGELVKH